MCLDVSRNEYSLRLPQHLRLFQAVAEKKVTANLTALSFTYNYKAMLIWSYFDNCVQ